MPTKKTPTKRKAPIRQYSGSPFWGPGPERFKARGRAPVSGVQKAKNLVKIVVFTPLLVGAAVLDRVFR